MPDEARDGLIELRPRGADAGDVIETGGSGAHAALRRIVLAVRRRPLASAASIVVVLALIVAGTQIERRPQANAAATVSPSATARQSTPATVPTDPPTPSTTPSPASTPSPFPTTIRLDTVERPPIDVVVYLELRANDGQRFSLEFAGASAIATAVPFGWLVQGSQTLWFLRSNGAAKPLLWQINSSIIGPRGDRVTWTKDGRVMAARIVNGELTGTDTADATDYYPQWFLGDAVVMVSFTDGAYALWRPTRGGFEPRPAHTSAQVLGPNGAGTALLGVESAEDKSCLVELNAETLKVSRRACILPAGWWQHTVSPGGRWLVMRSETRLVRIDLRTIFTKPTPPTEFLSDLDLSGAWADESTFMAMGPGVLRQITMTRPEQILEIPLTDVPTLDNGQPMYVFPVSSAVP